MTRTLSSGCKRRTINTLALLLLYVYIYVYIYMYIYIYIYIPMHTHISLNNNLTKTLTMLIFVYLVPFSVSFFANRFDGSEDVLWRGIGIGIHGICL